jgi:hypothetical protein
VQLVHWLLAAVEHVSCTAQFATSVQVAQVSSVPSTRYRPLLQVVHCSLLAELQVSWTLQPVMSSQAVQVMPLPKVPLGQAPHVPPVPGAVTSVQLTPLKQGLGEQPSVSVQVMPLPL